METILFKRNNSQGAVPLVEDLTPNEIAINTADGIIFYTNSATGKVASIGNHQISTLNGEPLEGTSDIAAALPGDLDHKALTVHTHTSEDILDDMNVFATNELVDNFTVAETNANSILAKILAIKALTPSGKIRMSETSDSKYLSQLIGDHISVKDGKLSVDAFRGMTITKEELESLSGVSSNILEQIKKLTSFSTFSVIVKTHADLLAVNAAPNDICIVEEDETRDSVSTTYVFNGVDWVYNGDYVSGPLRDYVLDPINLSTEVTGEFTDQLLKKQTASQTYITDTESVGEHDVDAALISISDKIVSLKQSVIDYFGDSLTINDDVTALLSKIESILSSIKFELAEKGVDATNMVLADLPSKILEVVAPPIPGKIYNTEPKVLAANTKLSLTFKCDIEIDTLCVTLGDVTPIFTTLFNKSFLNGYDGYTVNGIMGINASGIYPVIVFKYLHTNVGDKYNAYVDKLPQTIIF